MLSNKDNLEANELPKSDLDNYGAFDRVDIQRLRHPRLRNYTYESKSLKLKSRIDFFLVAKSLTQHVKKARSIPQ